MSPSGKAPDFDSGIRRFESCHPSHVRRRLLHSASAVFVSAAKAPYPQPPSSFSPRDPLCWARAGAPREAKNDPLAQSVEQLPFKQWVRGSNPRRVTTKISPKILELSRVSGLISFLAPAVMLDNSRHIKTKKVKYCCQICCQKKVRIRLCEDYRRRMRGACPDWPAASVGAGGCRCCGW